jgi:hypothetical protein
MENPRKQQQQKKQQNGRGGGAAAAAAGTSTAVSTDEQPRREGESEWAGLTLEQFRAEVPRDPDDYRFILSFTPQVP